MEHRPNRADNLTSFVCQLYRNSGASASWNPKGVSRPVAGKLYCTSRAPALLLVCAVHCGVRVGYAYVLYEPCRI